LDLLNAFGTTYNGGEELRLKKREQQGNGEGNMRKEKKKRDQNPRLNGSRTASPSPDNGKGSNLPSTSVWETPPGETITSGGPERGTGRKDREKEKMSLPASGPPFLQKTLEKKGRRSVKPAHQPPGEIVENETKVERKKERANFTTKKRKLWASTL